MSTHAKWDTDDEHCPPCGNATDGDDYYANHLRGPGGVSDEIALGWDRPEPDDITCASTDQEA